MLCTSFEYANFIDSHKQQTSVKVVHSLKNGSVSLELVCQLKVKFQHLYKWSHDWEMARGTIILRQHTYYILSRFHVSPEKQHEPLQGPHVPHITDLCLACVKYKYIKSHKHRYAQILYSINTINHNKNRNTRIQCAVKTNIQHILCSNNTEKNGRKNNKDK